MSLKKSPLYAEHLKQEAKMVPFAGWEMPISYDQFSGGIKSEHLWVRQNAGVFDVSHMGEFFIEGRDAARFLSLISTRDYTKPKNGRARYSLILNESGGILDDVIVYRYSEEKFLMVVNAANVDKIWSHLHSNKSNFDVHFQNRSDEIALIALQGPKAEEILSKKWNELKDLGYYCFLETESGEMIGRTGYTGEDGFEIFLKNENAPALWNNLIESGAKPIGLGARDSLRLEVGFPLYGNDLTEQTRPQETLSAFAVRNEHEFIGKQACQLQKQLIPLPLIADSPKPIRKNEALISSEGVPIGQISSGGYSPCLKRGIGVALSDVKQLKLPTAEGQDFFLESLGKRRQVTVKFLPFVETAKVKKK